MQIWLIGVNHRTAPVELRERLAFSVEQARRAATELRARGPLAEALVFSTCNRSELYGAAPASVPDAGKTMESYFYCFHGLSLAEVDGHAYSHAGLDAVRHIFRVTSGLDSMLLGEAEILGQVRDAYLRALEDGTTGAILNRLFQSALEVGKRVRAETDLGTRPMSAAFAAVKMAEQIFGKPRNHTALILGAGSVGEQVVEHLKDRGISRIMVANRSRERAQELAHRFEGEVVDWASLDRALVQPDILVTSVSSTDAVVSRRMLEQAMHVRGNRTLFVIDLGVPRNVEPEAGDLYNVYLYNVDDLADVVEHNRKARQSEIPKAEAIITEQVGKFEAWHAGAQLAALLHELRAKLQSEREEFLRERRAEIHRLSPEERARFGTLAEELLCQAFEEPAMRLRNRATRLRMHDVEALRRFFGLAREKS